MQNDFTAEQLFVEQYVYERPLSSYFRYSFEKFFPPDIYQSKRKLSNERKAF